jgi:hypothetical protein
MLRRTTKVWLLLGIVGAGAIAVVLAFGACEPTPAGITVGAAIEVAKQRVEADGVMSLDGRDTESEEESDSWHIYFPFTSHEIRGGEPHVWVDKSSGDVIDIYYTQ